MIFAFLIIMLSSHLFLPAQEASDEEPITALFQTACVDGLMNLGDLEKTRAEAGAVFSRRERIVR